MNKRAKETCLGIGLASGSQATLYAFTEDRTLPTVALVGSSVIKIIICKTLIRLDDIDKISRERVLTSFKATLDSSEGDNAGLFCHYAIAVNYAKQITLVTQYLASGPSFRQVSPVITNTLEVLGVGSIVASTEGTISEYTRFLCAMNVQRILEVLRKYWKLSISYEIATCMGTVHPHPRLSRRHCPRLPSLIHHYAWWK